MRISSRMTLSTLAAVIFTVVLLSAYFTREMRLALEAGEMRNQQAQLSLRVQHFTSGIDQLRSDTLLLSESPFIRKWFSESSVETNVASPHQTLLEQSFSSLLTLQPEYFQVRILSRSGKELVRVERQNGDVNVVQSSLLQDKSNKKYFDAARYLERGDVYLSDINLNEEFGITAKPEVITLRAAAPMFDDDGKLLGVLVINKNVGGFVRATVSGGSVGKVYILDASGHFIYHPQLEYTFAKQRNTDYTFSVLWPEVTGALAEALHRESDDLSTSNLIMDDYVVNAKKIVYQAGPSRKSISIVQMAPSSYISVQIYKVLEQQLVIVGFLLMLCIVVAWLFSQMVVKRVLVIGALSNHVASGGRDLDLPEAKGDEVDHVVQAFKAMVDQIDAREKLLSLEKIKIDAIFNTVSCGLLTTNADGYIEDINQFAAHLFCCERDAMVGKFIGDYFRKDLSTNTYVFQTHFVQPKAREHGNHWEVTGVRRGVAFPAQLSVAKFTLDGNLFYVASIEDISERKKVQLSLNMYAKKLEDSNKELQSFAYVASHDLQEPVRKIQSFGELLEREEKPNLSETGQLYLSRMTSAAERMRSLISSLLELSRVGREDAKPEWIDVERQCAEIVDDLGKLISETKAVITVGPLPHVWGEPVQVRRLLQNLIGNALKYSEKGVVPEIELGVYCPVEPSFRQHPELERLPVAFFVQDNGIGIAPEHREQIFMAFERLHGRSQYQGNGIGLAICKKIVESMGGIIFVDDSEVGARFVVALPKSDAVE